MIQCFFMLTRIQLLILLPFFYQNSLSQLQELYIFLYMLVAFSYFQVLEVPFPLRQGAPKSKVKVTVSSSVSV